jgi:hypothetical protein
LLAAWSSSKTAGSSWWLQLGQERGPTALLLAKHVLLLALSQAPVLLLLLLHLEQEQLPLLTKLLQ